MEEIDNPIDPTPAGSQKDRDTIAVPTVSDVIDERTAS